MKKSKKIISTLTLLVMLVSSKPVFASEYKVWSGSHTFTSSWEVPVYGSDWVMKYGFNTFLINEDYTHTKHNSVEHMAVVVNKYSSNNMAEAGYWAKIEVRHNSDTVLYGIKY